MEKTVGRLSSDVSKQFSKDFLVNSVHFDTNLIGAPGYEEKSELSGHL